MLDSPFQTFAAESEISFSVGESVEEFEYYDYFDENKGMICGSAKAGPLIKRVTKIIWISGISIPLIVSRLVSLIEMY